MPPATTAPIGPPKIQPSPVVTATGVTSVEDLELVDDGGGSGRMTWGCSGKRIDKLEGWG